jgi:hypothetical protein
MQVVIAVFIATGLFVQPAAAIAHCDALDGPVVKAAQRALDSGDIAGVLIWVQAADEAEIRDVYHRVRLVRAHGGNAKTLADRYFFETVVRVHRAGEGQPFTGREYVRAYTAFLEYVERLYDAAAEK